MTMHEEGYREGWDDCKSSMLVDIDDLTRQLADLKRAESDRAALVEVLRSVEWAGDDFGYDACPKCNAIKSENHRPDCALDAALARYAAGPGPGEEEE